MDSSNDKKLHAQQFRALLARADEIAQRPVTNCSEEETDILLTVIRNTNIFQKNLDSQISLEDFLQRIKYFITYETHPKGTVLLQEWEQTEKLSIILKGTAIKYHQKTMEEVENEAAQLDPGFSLQKIPEERDKESSPTGQDRSPKPSYYKSSTLSSRKKETTKIVKSRTDIRSPMKRSAAVSGKNLDQMDKEESSPSPERSIEMEEEDDQDGIEEDDKKLRRSATKDGPIDKKKSNKGAKKMKKMKAMEQNIIMEVLSTVIMDNEAIVKSKAEDIELFKMISEQTPQLTTKYFIGDILKMKRVKRLHAGSHYGEDFLKQNKPKDNILIASEDVHVLTINKESYLHILEQLFEEAQDKLTFFSNLFPFLSERTANMFAYYFKELLFKKGEKIYSEEDPAKGIYLLRSGDVRLFKNVESLPQPRDKSPNSDHLFKGAIRPVKPTLQVTSVVEGQYFGEEILLKETARAFTAISHSALTKVYYLEAWLYQKIRGNFVDIFNTIKTQAKDKLTWRQRRVEEMLTNQMVGSMENLGSPTRKPPALESKDRIPPLMPGSPTFSRPKNNVKGSEYYQFQEGSNAVDNIIVTEPSRPYPNESPKQRKTSFDDMEVDPSTAKNLEIYKEKFFRKKNVYRLMENEKVHEKANHNKPVDAPLTLHDPLPSLKRNKKNKKVCLSISISQKQASPTSNGYLPTSLRKESNDSFRRLAEPGHSTERKAEPLQPTATNMKSFRSNLLNVLIPGFDKEKFEDIVLNRDVVKNQDGSLTLVTGRSRLRGILNTFEKSSNLYDAFHSPSPKKPGKIQLEALQHNPKTESEPKRKIITSKKKPPGKEIVSSPSDKLFLGQNDPLGQIIMTQKVKLVKH